MLLKFGCNPDHYYTAKFKSIIDELEKENMPEKKRYQLELPENIKLSQAEMATILKPWNGKEIDLDVTSLVTNNQKVRIEDIPKSWLVEIKEESRPCMANEYAYAFNSCHPNLNLPKDIIIQIFESGIKATELKHQETESFEEWKDKNARWLRVNTVGVDEARYIWAETLKSRGYK